MIWVAVVFLTIVFFGGIARLVWSQRGSPEVVPESERSLTRAKLLCIGIVGIVGSILGFLSLYIGILGPVEAILAVAAVVSLIEITIRAQTAKSAS